MYDVKCMYEKIRIKNIFNVIKFKIEFRKNNPHYFNADGLIMFCGAQGTGKTLTAVNYVYKLMQFYPKCKLVTNLHLRDYPVVEFHDWKKINANENENDKELYDRYKEENRVFSFLNNDDLQKYENESFGVIYFIDEIQLYMNSLQSKNINMDVMTQISQQRKQRKHIVATSQVFGRIAKPLREQFSNVVLCKNYFKIFQINALIDRDSIDTEETTSTNLKGKVKKKFFYIHSPEMYARYDTSNIIRVGLFNSGKGDIYDDKSINN